MNKRILTILMLGIITASLIPIQATFAMEVPATITLWAAQNIDVGPLTVNVIGTNLIVTFETTDGWYLTETHLYVGGPIPSKSAPGKFPYKHEGLGDATIDSYTIPLSEVGGYGWKVIAAHAVVRRDCQEETAWADGCPIRTGKNGKDKNWAMYFGINIPSPT